MDERSLDEVSQRTGLSIEACRNMLDAGWVYVETVKTRGWQRNNIFHVN